MTYPDLDRLGFDLSDDQRAVRETMMRFGAERLAPGAAERDKAGLFPTDVMAEFAALGGMAMKVAPEDDGPGLDAMKGECGDLCDHRLPVHRRCVSALTMTQEQEHFKNKISPCENHAVLTRAAAWRD